MCCVNFYIASRNNLSLYPQCSTRSAYSISHAANYLVRDKVEITETTLRDGIQAFHCPIHTNIKLIIINNLVRAGFSSMEIGSFVDSRKVPNMADTPKLFKKRPKNPNIKYWALVANQRGLEAALKSGACHLSFPTSVSEKFIKKNINCSIEQSLERLSCILKQKQFVKDLKVRVYISCCPICPEEGFMHVEKIANLAYRLFQMGCDEIFPSDTVGQATPSHIRDMLIAIQKKKIPMEKIGLHLHGEGEKVLENVNKGLFFGVRSFDSSMGELGGCPVLKDKMKGNIPTEQIVPFLHSKGFATGIDMDTILKTTLFLKSFKEI